MAIFHTPRILDMAPTLVQLLLAASAFVAANGQLSVDDKDLFGSLFCMGAGGDQECSYKCRDGSLPAQAKEYVSRPGPQLKLSNRPMHLQIS